MKKTEAFVSLVLVVYVFFFSGIANACKQCSSPVWACGGFDSGGTYCGWTIGPCGEGELICAHWEYQCDLERSSQCNVPSQIPGCTGTLPHNCWVKSGSNIACVNDGSKCQVLCPGGGTEWKPCCGIVSYDGWSCAGTWYSCY